MKKVVIAGGSGLIGSAVTNEFLHAGYEVVVLSRSGKGPQGARSVRWDASGPGDWYNEVNGADVVINLCGENLMTKWTSASIARIRESRIGTTHIIGAAIAASDKPAKTWINASAVGWYGDTGPREISEGTASSTDFLGQLCKDWEDEVAKAGTASTRTVRIRIGMVLGKSSEFYKMLSKVTKMFLGGPLGSGHQYVPWIHLKDLARLFLWAAENDVTGSVNGTAPHPVTNTVLMAAFRKAMGRPPSPAAPEAVIKQVCGFMGWPPSMLLGGTRAVPAIALARGFAFEFDNIDKALEDIIDDVPQAWKPIEVTA